MYLYGASGHAKVVKEILEDSGQEVKAIFDDNPEVLTLEGLSVSGFYDKNQFLDCPMIITIGYNEIRRKIASTLKGISFGMAIHSRALVSTSAKIGEGSVIMAGSIINAAVRIGKHTIINTASSVDHDSVLGDFVHIAPHATLCGGVHVGDGVLVGAGATVIPMVNIGKWATIGAGAVVVSNIPDYAVAVGNPAKIIKYHKPHA